MRTGIILGLVALLALGCETSLPTPTDRPSASPGATGSGGPSASPGGETPSAPPVEASTLRIGLAVDPGFGLVPLHRAIEALDDAAGVTVELSTLDSAMDAIRASTIAELDLAIVPLLPAINAVSGGVGIRTIMADALTTDELLIARPGLAAVGELEGSPVAGDPPGTHGRAIAALCLERSGLDPDAVRFVDVGGPASRRTAIVTDLVAAATLPATLGLEAVRDDSLAILANCGRAIGPLLQTGVVGSDEFLAEHPVLVQQFVDAYVDAQRWAVDDRDGYVERSREVARGLDDDLRRALHDELRMAGRFAVDGGLTGDRIDGLVAFGLDAALLQSPVADDWYALDWVSSYLERHGPA